MLKKHTFSPNHKVVEKSPHNFSPSGGSPGPGNMTGGGSGGPGKAPSAEPAGGGAQGPQDGMFADGGGIKDVWQQMTQPQPGRQVTVQHNSPKQPIDSNSGYKASGPVGKDFDDSTDKAVKDNGG